jgi:cytochrome oxidase Cu insertion factor (SCO1/SenC/PrrC family)
VRSEALLSVLLCAAVAAAEPAAPERLQHADRSTLADTYAPGAFEPSYTPPPAGSYELPVIRTVRDHPLLDAAGKPTTLFAVTADRVAVVAFVYLACVEAGGCPVSHAVQHGLDRALADDPALAKRVTLVTVSFDPDRDTPDEMAEQRRLHAPRTDWAFLTTRGGAELDRLLADFDQPVAKLRYQDGVWSGLYRHVLKVFLLDGAHRVRAIYSTGFLDRALVLNDLKTLLAETKRSAAD